MRPPVGPGSPHAIPIRPDIAPYPPSITPYYPNIPPYCPHHVILSRCPPISPRYGPPRRSRLEAELSRAGEELSGARAALEALQALGPGFQAAAEEYGRLRERLRHRRWALRQLRGHDGGGDVADDVTDDDGDGGPA